MRVAKIEEDERRTAEDAAALKIQSLQRGKKARRKVVAMREVKLEEKASAVAIDTTLSRVSWSRMSTSIGKLYERPVLS